jgi:hypothetical protein
VLTCVLCTILWAHWRLVIPQSGWVVGHWFCVSCVLAHVLLCLAPFLDGLAFHVGPLVGFVLWCIVHKR